MTSFKDYYVVLGIKKGELDLSGLRRNYHRLAKKYHPDANKEPGASQKMQEINEAWNVLKDEERRKAYDKIYDQRQAELRAEGGRPSDGSFNDFRQAYNLDEMLRRYQVSLDELIRRSMARDSIFGVWDTRGKSYQDLERERKEHSQQESEVRRAKALGERIQLPENDVYLMAAMIKLLRDRSLQKAEVKDETGRLIWEVRSFQPLIGWVVRRTISDWVDTRVRPKIDLGWKGKRSPTELFEIDDIDFLSMRGVPQVPKLIKDYVYNLEDIAERLTEPGMPRVSDSLVSRAWGIKSYLKENERLLQGVRIKEVTIGRMNEGLDESRIALFRETHEGKPRVV
jgi:curved DNA-binding protein CbpA